MSLGNPCGVLRETRGDSFDAKLANSSPFLGFKISKLSDCFAGHRDPNVLRGSIGVPTRAATPPVLKM